ncbi:MAG: hypothetical protein KF861_24070 [Planctomycetaceae bacterium]|nr:hypothetical protein [Planctomycetaceae bacterium]
MPTRKPRAADRPSPSVDQIFDSWAAVLLDLAERIDAPQKTDNATSTSRNARNYST